MTEFEIQLLKELRAIREAIETLSVKPSSNNFSDSKTLQVEETPAMSKINQESMTNQEHGLKYHYFGTPDGSGFEEPNEIYEINSPKILYVIETVDGINGRFYPIGRSFSRLRSNAKSFLIPLCDFSIPLEEMDTLDVSKENYGEIVLKDGYWEVIRKCII